MNIGYLPDPILTNYVQGYVFKNADPGLCLFTDYINLLQRIHTIQPRGMRSKTCKRKDITTIILKHHTFKAIFTKTKCLEPSLFIDFTKVQSEIPSTQHLPQK